MTNTNNSDNGQNIAREGQSEFAGDQILQSDSIMGRDNGTFNKEFSHVSGRWIASDCQTFEAAKAALIDDQRKIQDFKAPLCEWDVVVTDKGIVFKHLPTGQEFAPTDHALNGVCAVGQGLSSWAVRNMLAPIPHRTKKDADGEKVIIDGGQRGQADFEVLRDYIRVHLFNAERVDQEKTRLFRTWTDGTMRALLSDQYTIVNNVWFLDLLESIIPGGLVSHWRGDADSIYGNILIPDTIRAESDSDFGGMLSVGNSEIGTRRISSLPSVFRAICMNGCIWDQELGKALRKVHRGVVDFEALGAMIRENLESQIPLLPQGIERVLGLRAFGCGDVPMTNMLAQTAETFKMSKPQIAAVAEGWGEEISLLGPKEGKTAYGLSNAVTRAGQTLSNDKWVEFDTIGGDFASMDRDGWDKFRSRAGKLDAKAVKGKLGQLVAA